MILAQGPELVNHCLHYGTEFAKPDFFLLASCMEVFILARIRVNILSEPIINCYMLSLDANLTQTPLLEL